MNMHKDFKKYLSIILSLNAVIWSQSDAPETTAHKYAIEIVDIDDNPLPGVRIDYKIKERETILLRQDSIVTDANGKSMIITNASRDPRYQSYTSFRTTLDYSVSKPAFYPKKGRLTSNYYPGNNSEKPIVESKITLTSPNDYFANTFLAQPGESSLRQSLMHLIDPNIIDQNLDGTSLMYRSIGVFIFKNKRYLNFSFENDNVFNSLKLSKYDIGKRMFDEVVRKTLTPLNSNITDKTKFFGYALLAGTYRETPVGTFRAG